MLAGDGLCEEKAAEFVVLLAMFQWDTQMELTVFGRATMTDCADCKRKERVRGEVVVRMEVAVLLVSFGRLYRSQHVQVATSRIGPLSLPPEYLAARFCSKRRQKARKQRQEDCLLGSN